MSSSADMRRGLGLGLGRDVEEEKEEKGVEVVVVVRGGRSARGCARRIKDAHSLLAALYGSRSMMVVIVMSSRMDDLQSGWWRHLNGRGI